jgi:hypothetical protein
VRSERVHRALLVGCAISAAACIAELLWLRTAQITVTRPLIAVLFVPWLAAAAANLGVWYFTVARGAATPLNRLSGVLLRIVSAVFALAFLALYGWLLFGALPG